MYVCDCEYALILILSCQISTQLVMVGSVKLLQSAEASRWEGSGEPSDDCREACQLHSELLLGDAFIWRETNFSDCSVTCGTGRVSNVTSCNLRLTLSAYIIYGCPITLALSR